MPIATLAVSIVSMLAISHCVVHTPRGCYRTLEHDIINAEPSRAVTPVHLSQMTSLFLASARFNPRLFFLSSCTGYV